MNKTSLRRCFASLLFIVLALAGSAAAWADPPSRVVRLAYASGPVSFSPAGENDWVYASLNRPLITGDRLWADQAARTELHLGSTAMRMGPDTSLTLLNVDDHIAQLQLTQGTLNLHVRRLERDHAIEVDTPNLAYAVRRPGSYRIEVPPDGSSTSITVRSGEGEVFGEGNAFVLTEGQTYRFYGNDLRDYETYAFAPPDEFDRWSADRDRRWERSVSARYVSPSMIGYEDLDDYGSWREAPGYGHVWVPTHVAADWAPYRDGHWAWIEPWGWTWVDNAPWGFAPSHYGRWARVDERWAWVPGPVQERSVYAPAVVQFVGGSGPAGGDRGSNLNTRDLLTIAGVAAVAWFALAPHEVYQPPYPASHEYLNAVNRSNTVVSTTNITNVYNTTNVTNVYVNRQVPGGVVAVPSATFAQSKPVAAQALRVTQETVARAPVVSVASIAPARTSVLGAAAAASVKPPTAVVARPVVAKTAPPPAPVSFEARQHVLAANPGKPPEPATVARVKPAAPAAAAVAAAPVVRVVTAATRAVPLPPKPASAPAAAERARAEAAAPAASRPALPPMARVAPASTPARAAVAVPPASAPPRTAMGAPPASATARNAMAAPPANAPRRTAIVVPPAASRPALPPVARMEAASAPRQTEAPSRRTAAAPTAASRPALPPTMAQRGGASAVEGRAPMAPRTAAVVPRPPDAGHPAASAAVPPLPHSTNAFAEPHASAPAQAERPPHPQPQAAKASEPRRAASEPRGRGERREGAPPPRERTE